jgi:hypothetical protein
VRPRLITATDRAGAKAEAIFTTSRKSRETERGFVGIGFGSRVSRRCHALASAGPDVCRRRCLSWR